MFTSVTKAALQLPNPVPLLVDIKASTLETKVHQVMFDTMKRVNFKRNYRLENYKQNPMLLQNGAFYGQDLFKIYLGDKTTYSWIEKFRKSDQFYNGKAPATFISMPAVDGDPTCPSGILPCTFIIRPGIKPSEALDSLECQDITKTAVGLSFLDCSTVCEYAIYRSLQSVWGVEKFDALFSYDASKDSQTQLALGLCLPMNPLHLFLIQESRTEKELKNGDWIYWKNDPRYSYKYPYEPDFGQHAFYVQDSEKIVGFGLETDGLSLKNIPKHFLEVLTKPPLAEYMVSSELDAKVKRVSDPDAVCKIKSGFLSEWLPTESEIVIEMDPEVKILNFQRIEQLAGLPIDQAKAQLDQWQRDFFMQISN